MRIAVVIRGLSHYRYGFFEALASKAEVTVFYSSLPPRPDLAKIRYELPDRHVATYTPLRALVFRRPISHLPAILTLGLTKEVLASRPDVVVLEGESNLVNNFFLIPALVRAGVPYWWWGLGNLPGRPESLRRKIIKPLHRLMLRAAAGAVCYSTHAMKYYRSLGSKRSIVAFNTLDTDQIAADIAWWAGRSEGIRSELGIPPQAKVILFVGTFEPTKDLDRLIEAYGLIARSLTLPVSLVLVGEGPSKGDLQERTTRSGVKGVVFTGERTVDITPLFLESSVFVLPGLGGLAIQHAMAHGLPVISAYADGTEQDLVEPGVNGYLLPAAYQPSVLARYLERILLDDSLRLRMGQESARRVAERFNIRVTIDTLLEGLREGNQSNS